MTCTTQKRVKRVYKPSRATFTSDSRNKFKIKFSFSLFFSLKNVFPMQSLQLQAFPLGKMNGNYLSEKEVLL